MNKNRKRTKRQGFTLMECTVAVGVACLSLVPMIGLLPVGLTGARSASTQTAAMNIATALAADLRTSVAQESPRFGVNLGSSGSEQVLYLDESGAPVAGLNAQSRYKARVILTPVTDSMKIARITISWPPAAPDNAATSVETVVSVD